MYKRVERKSIFSFKPWKQRHFQVDQRVLLCYREPHSVNPLRTIPLAACHVEVIEKDPKYGETRFDIINYSNNCRFQLMAKDKDQRNKWVTLLRRFVHNSISRRAIDALYFISFLFTSFLLHDSNCLFRIPSFVPSQ